LFFVSTLEPYDEVIHSRSAAAVTTHSSDTDAEDLSSPLTATTESFTLSPTVNPDTVTSVSEVVISVLSPTTETTYPVASFTAFQESLTLPFPVLVIDLITGAERGRTKSTLFDSLVLSSSFSRTALAVNVYFPDAEGVNTNA